MRMRRNQLFWGLFFIFLCLFVYTGRPNTSGTITGQTIFLSFRNYFHIKANSSKAQFMLIDDDSGYGIFQIHEICERLGVKATFAVVPAFLDSIRCDSLRKWQKAGYGIALHGYNHGQWNRWSEEDIANDIIKSLDFLQQRGFDIENIRLVVSPSFYNTISIRAAVKKKGMKLVLGGNVVNPDTSVSIWGRIFINKNTDMSKISKTIDEAVRRKQFIVFGTHSSIEEEFSSEKTENTLMMIKEILKNLCD